MKCLIFLCLVVLATAKIININDCEGIVVDGVSHTKETLKEYVERPYQLAMDYNNNVLYFSYSRKSRDIFALGNINLNTKEFDTVTGVNGGFANAVDEKTHSVYFGGSDGIYKLNFESKKATNLAVTDENVWQLFFKDGLYFTTYPDEQVYLYKDNQVTKVTEIGNTTAMLVGVNNGHNIFFSNSSGLFYYNKRDAKTTHVGDYILNGITSDINGRIYFCTPSGIFVVDDKTNEVKKLATIINIYGIAIESDGSILYSSENSIIRLKSTGKVCVSELDTKPDN